MWFDEKLKLLISGNILSLRRSRYEICWLIWYSESEVLMINTQE